MAMTNFAALTDFELTIWARKFWENTWESTLISEFAGKSENSVIQRITDLTKDRRGARAVITLVKDMQGDGTTGDNTLEGNEESLESDEMVINIDQLRMAARKRGEMAEQRSIVRFREAARRKLAKMSADRVDQMAFLTLGGIDYKYRPDGSKRPADARTGQKLQDLVFAKDVEPPSDDRHVYWDASAKKLVKVTGNKAAHFKPSAIAATDTLSYETIIRLREFARSRFVQGVSGKGNTELYYMFIHDSQFADLKLDADFKENARNAAPRSKDNVVFSGAMRVMLDGIMIVPFRHVPSTLRRAAKEKYGSDGNVEGARALFCGQQALAMCDLDGSWRWHEKKFDYDNQLGIAVGKMLGFRKPQFDSLPYYKTKEDFGVVCCDTAIKGTV